MRTTIMSSGSRRSITTRQRNRIRTGSSSIILMMMSLAVMMSLLASVTDTFGTNVLSPRRRAFVSTATRRLSFQRTNDEESSRIDRLSPEPSNNVLEDQDTGNIHIPSSGISVSDEMEAAQKDRFVTELVPVEGLPGVAQLVTTPVATGSFEPVRYLVALSPPPNNATSHDNNDTTATTITDYVMVDIPPFSPQLVAQINDFMSLNSTTTTGGRLVAILSTNRDSIHYNDAPAVYSTRRADLRLWASAFNTASISIVAYRLDIPRDCRYAVTQVLDGYGPWHYCNDNNESSSNKDENNNTTTTTIFVESGRPLTYAEWDHAVAQDVMRGVTPPPDDDNVTASDDDSAYYTPKAIRKRQQGKRILAVYTPGHSFGSVSYVFPEMGVCCSGFTLPVEDTRYEENADYSSSSPAGPALDCRGYITTSRGGIQQQMQSARELVETYGDRFEVVLPARGDPLFLDGDSTEERKQTLLDILDQYKRIGDVYAQLGITTSDDDIN